MAIEAQIYADNNLGIPFLDHGIGVNVCDMEDDDNLGFNMTVQPQEKYGNPQLVLHQQQQQYYTQSQHQQYLFQQQQQLYLKNQFQATGNFVFRASRNAPSSNITTTLTTGGGPSIKNNNSYSNTTSNIDANNILSAQMEKQSLEMDRAINLQTQRLKLAFQEQRNKQLASIVQSIESRAMILLRQKQQQIAQSTKRAQELEILLKKIDNENQAWKQIATEKEAIIINLNTSLEQLKMQTMFCKTENVDDAESRCEENSDKRKQESPGLNRNKRRRLELETMIMGTDDRYGKGCISCGNSCAVVVFIPCRHMCSCKDCEPILDACPVCNSPKQGSIEAIIS